MIVVGTIFGTVRNRTSPAAIRCRESLIKSSYEEVAGGRFDQFDQAALGSRVRLDRTIGQNVANRCATLGERAGDQETAMTIERLALGTHQAKAMAGRLGKDAIDPGFEARRLRHGLVVGNSIAVERRIAWPPAKRFAEEQIAYILASEQRRQVFLREPGAESRH